ncbi:hypothetical protein LWI29_034161 [Acer saccharum]|uniref:Uncharacterized protein n=1 Tax=Acer saccharum TaxID=4024 RepID=A0AA39W7G0_ACESA|nr:hypothetical protein LWI29_034161 [Acer saccharum]
MCIKAVGRKTHHSKVEMRKPDLQVSGGIGNMIKLRKGLWSPEEDEKLMSYMVNNGQGCWSDVARNAGLQRWSQIAARLPGRTDNEIKNFWNSTIKKRLKNLSSSSSSPPPPSTTSPNTSDSSSDHHQRKLLEANMGGGGGGLVMTMHEHGSNGIIMPMYMDTSSSSTSPSSLPFSASMVLNHMMMDVQLPVLEHGMNMFHENHHHGYDPSPCMAQVGMSGGGGCFYGEQGYFGEIYVPPLESVSKEENAKTENNHRNTNNNNQLVNNTNIVDDNDKAENVTDGVGNFSWQEEEEEIKLGEWDLEELMKDVSNHSPLSAVKKGLSTLSQSLKSSAAGSTVIPHQICIPFTSASPPNRDITAAPIIDNTHSMTTRGKNGIYKPKVYQSFSASSMLDIVPSTVTEALKYTAWKNAMQAEYKALQDNNA